MKLNYNSIENIKWRKLFKYIYTDLKKDFDLNTKLQNHDEVEEFLKKHKNVINNPKVELKLENDWENECRICRDLLVSVLEQLPGNKIDNNSLLVVNVFDTTFNKLKRNKRLVNPKPCRKNNIDVTKYLIKPETYKENTKKKPIREVGRN